MDEMINGLPNFCGLDAQVEEVTSRRDPIYLNQTDLKLDRLQSCFAVALHMHQPLIGGKGLILHGLSAGMKSAGEKAGAWVEADGINKPLPGDFYVLENPKGKFSHVGVVVDDSTGVWRTADSGQVDGFAAGYRDRRGLAVAIHP